MNPWEKLKPFTKPDILIEESLSKASRESRKISFRGKLETVRRKERVRILVVYRNIVRNLRRSYKIVNAYLKANDFYKDLVKIYFSEDEILVLRSKIRNMILTAEKLKEKYIDELNESKSVDDMGRIRRECLGRLISIVKRNRKLLNTVLELWKYAHKLPSISIDEPVVVVAGPPNVGKSTLVNTFSTAEVKVASYPFTTKDIHVGHLFTDFYRIQLIDTPGLLDRPLSERNDIEMKAIIALRHLSDIIIFMFDPSPFRYYELEEQLSIYNEIRDSFPTAIIIPVINKIDVVEADINKYLGNLDVMRLSLALGIGVDDLRSRIISLSEEIWRSKLH